jgi:hypothetical protein
MAWAGTTTLIDNFDRAQAFTTTPGHNGWTIKDTSSAGTPTYLCITEDGGAAKLTLVSNDEVEIVTLYQNDVLPFDLRMISHVWWVAKVADIASNTTLTFGVANAQNDDEDAVTVSSWFRMEGATSTTAIVVEADDATNETSKVATGKTLAAVYKKFLIDFSQGLGDIRFFIDGERVAAGTTFTMASVAAGQNVQPFIQLQKASSTNVASITIAQFGITYKWSYGA